MSNCGCGSESRIGATVRNLVAWAQLNGAGRCNDMLYAMTDGDWPGVRISNVSYSRRGPLTPIYRRTAARESQQCGEREGARSNNSITVEFAACGCGSVDVSEMIDCGFDLYQPEICCGGVDRQFDSGWSKMKVWQNIRFNSSDYSAGVSFNQEDDNDLIISHPGIFTEMFTLYPLDVTEVTAATGQTNAFTDVSYFCGGGCQSCGCGCECSDCADSWAAITATGYMVFRTRANQTLQSSQVTGWPANATKGLVAYWGGKYYAAAVIQNENSQIFTAACKAPTTWTALTTSEDLQLNGMICNKGQLIGFGQCGVGSAIYSLSQNRVISKGDCQVDLAGCGFNLGSYEAVLACGNKIVTTGGCFTSGTNSDVTTLGSRDCELWAGTDAGAVQVSTDDGDTWETITNLPDTGAGTIIGIAWANKAVGYIVKQIADGSYAIYSTMNGGNTWGDDRIELPTGATIQKIVTPCCKNQTLRANRLLLAGSILTRGAVWEGSPAQC